MEYIEIHKTWFNFSSDYYLETLGKSLSLGFVTYKIEIRVSTSQVYSEDQIKYHYFKEFCKLYKNVQELVLFVNSSFLDTTFSFVPPCTSYSRARGRVKSRNMYKGPMDKDNGVQGGLNVEGGGG